MKIELTPGIALRFRLAAKEFPDPIHYSTSYGGQWESDWCVVFTADGSAGVTRLTLADSMKEFYCANPGRMYPPWRQGGSTVVAWAYLSESREAIAQAVQP
jgi:hypothetical protein